MKKLSFIFIKCFILLFLRLFTQLFGVDHCSLQLYLTRSLIISSLLAPVLFLSLSIISNHLVFDLPLPLFPATSIIFINLITSTVSFFFKTYPNYLNLFFHNLTTLEAITASYIRVGTHFLFFIVYSDFTHPPQYVHLCYTNSLFYLLNYCLTFWSTHKCRPLLPYKIYLFA